ncbi:hypothetical protein SAMN02910356_00240 [Selenomonas sp. GACV-9]|uniref:hypothetical protein n=1 Tax=Selenomonas sp. GACV-9 TaxID=3158782 RepID=UPI0008F2A620|nr:hypothetical protein SAMN02910356_00240 [Selenomonas ruminantium]
MKKCLGIVLGAAVWGALLYVQGTPVIDEQIAEDVVRSVHPDTAFCETERIGTGDEESLRVAYVTTDMQQGEVTFAKDGHVLLAEE